jgi:serine protease
MHTNDDNLPSNSPEFDSPASGPCQPWGGEAMARGLSMAPVLAGGSALALGVGLLLAGAPAGAQMLEAPAPMDVAQLLERVHPARAVPGEIIVKFRESQGPTPRLRPEAAAPLGLSTAAVPTSGGELIYRLNVGVLLEAGSPSAVAERVDQVVAKLNAREDVEYAQPNWIVHPTATPADPGYASQWHYWMNGSGPNQSPGGINLPKAWDTTRGDPSVVVAVIDTGILPAHPDITGSPNLTAGYDMISNAFTANDGDGRDADPTDPGDAVVADECGPGEPAEPSSWHGSHVAGTIGVGNSDNPVGVAGVNWHTRVQAVRVLGKCGGSIADINDAIRWAAGLPVPGVPSNPTPARVINMSLGADAPCSASPSTQAAINDAVAAGVTVVVAAGNSAMDASGSMPASCIGPITVAASDARGFLVTRYSNFGPRVDIMAPGGDVRRDDNGDGDPDGVLSTVQGGYAYYNGTSMAAPHVAGVAALLLSREPSQTPAGVLARLQAAATPRDATQCPKPCGAGLLNAALFKEVQEQEQSLPFHYAAKVICGLQKDEGVGAATPARYGTIVNIRNSAEPGGETVLLTKELALALPPGFQEQGKLLPLGRDKLEPAHALATDCDDLRKRTNGGLPDFFDGFVTVRSTGSLDVSAVYTTAAIDREGRLAGQAGIDVEPVAERVAGSGGKRADLAVTKITNLGVNCPGGGGTCVTTVDAVVTNQGSAPASVTSTTRGVFDPAQSVTVDRPQGTLAPGASGSVTFTTPPGGNCFDPDCTVCVTADALGSIDESDESNNQLCVTHPG